MGAGSAHGKGDPDHLLGVKCWIISYTCIWSNLSHANHQCLFVFLWFSCSDELRRWSPPSYCLHCRCCVL